MTGDPRWCAENPSGQRVHRLTWDELNADGRLISVPCREHAEPRRWPGGVLDITGNDRGGDFAEADEPVTEVPHRDAPRWYRRG